MGLKCMPARLRTGWGAHNEVVEHVSALFKLAPGILLTDRYVD